MNASNQPAVPAVGRRVMSMVYDLMLLLAVLFIAAFLFVTLTRYTGQPHIRPFFQLYLLGVIGGYYLWFWLHGGQTLPMKTWHIRLEMTNGEKITLGRALLRFALGWLCLFGIGILWAFFDHERQFLHDRLAGTRLVSTKP